MIEKRYQYFNNRGEVTWTKWFYLDDENDEEKARQIISKQPILTMKLKNEYRFIKK